MTRARRRSTSSSHTWAVAARAALVAAALAGVVASLPRAAHAQACCVGTGLVNPARLRMFEDRALGFQTRARSVVGAFGDQGSFAASTAGSRDMSFQQDLFGAIRLGPRFQVAGLVPFVATNREAAGISGWGAGVGDVAANVRYDLILAGERGRWPGVALLAGLAVPTGRSPDEARDPLATSATGTGSFEGNMGLAIETTFGHGFVAASGWIAQRSGRAVGGVDQSFAPRLSALLAGGYTFKTETTVGLYAHGVRQGNARDQGGSIAGSAVGLVTAGVAVAIPFWDAWRLAGSLFTDVPISGWGRNQNAGVGSSAALLRYWM
jgi:hypothetical protein